MAIPTDKLNKKFIVVEAHATVGQVREQVKGTKNNWTYICVSLPSGEYAVLRLTDIIAALQNISTSLTPALLESPLDTLSLLETRASSPIEQSSATLAEAQRLVNAAPGQRLVIIKGDTVVGVLAVEKRAVDRKVDPGWLDQISQAQAEPGECSSDPVSKPQTITDDRRT